MNNYKGLYWTFTGCVLLLALSACGYNNPSSTQSSNNNNNNNSSGTQTNGPVRISTDHSRYGPSSPIQVTIQNTLATPIYALDTQAGCSILGMEAQVDGQWQGSSVARCPLGRPAMVVKIDAKQTSSVSIHPSNYGPAGALFPAGIYRFILTYSTSANRGSLSASTVTVYSQPVTVFVGA